jgi:hypothetical protein
VCEADDYGVEPLVEVSPRARKEHRCFACKEAIRPGDRYRKVIQIYDGEFEIFKHCLRCWRLMNAILDAGAETVQWDLNCGTSWEKAFERPIPDEVAALAFMTPDEAQGLEKER